MEQSSTVTKILICSFQLWHSSNQHTHLSAIRFGWCYSRSWMYLSWAILLWHNDYRFFLSV